MQSNHPLFSYGQKEMDYLCSRDAHLAVIIRQLGKIERMVIPDLFEALVHTIVGQQISAKAHQTIWTRITSTWVNVSPHSVLACSESDFRALGISARKAAYIQSAARKLLTGEVNIEEWKNLPDEILRSELMTLDGVGEWTAEMLLIFSLQRTNVLSFKDYAIRRGMEIVYHHEKLTKELFDNHYQVLSPYATIAGFYYWAVANGACLNIK